MYSPTLKLLVARVGQGIPCYSPTLKLLVARVGQVKRRGNTM